VYQNSICGRAGLRARAGGAARDAARPQIFTPEAKRAARQKQVSSARPRQTTAVNRACDPLQFLR
jgi:hypothetical protein